MFQENKARQIFRKTNTSYPLIRTRTCAYQKVRNVRFSENLAGFVFLKHLRFALLPYYRRIVDFPPFTTLVFFKKKKKNYSLYLKKKQQDSWETKKYLLPIFCILENWNVWCWNCHEWTVTFWKMIENKYNVAMDPQY